MDLNQIAKNIKQQETIIAKATKRLAIYEEMRVLTQALREVDSGVTTPQKKVPAAQMRKKRGAPAVHPEVAAGIKEIAKDLNLRKPAKSSKGKKKKHAKPEVPVTPFVHEAMGLMPTNFTSSDLLETACNCVYREKAPITLKQVKSAVHGYLYGASHGRIKTNPYPLTYTGKKNAKKQRIYQRAVVAPKNLGA